MRIRERIRPRRIGVIGSQELTPDTTRIDDLLYKIDGHRDGKMGQEKDSGTTGLCHIPPSRRSTLYFRF